MLLNWCLYRYMLFCFFHIDVCTVQAGSAAQY